VSKPALRRPTSAAPFREIDNRHLRAGFGANAESHEPAGEISDINPEILVVQEGAPATVVDVRVETELQGDQVPSTRNVSSFETAWLIRERSVGVWREMKSGESAVRTLCSLVALSAAIRALTAARSR
jgi:hypothetical protein